jgi:outer membrane protein insertion porin family
MLVGNLELQIPVIENQLYGLLFFDAGNSWLHKNDIKLRKVYRGVGLGFRLVVPGVGTIGFDFGYPLDERRGQSKGWHPHFQVGTTFR